MIIKIIIMRITEPLSLKYPESPAFPSGDGGVKDANTAPHMLHIGHGVPGISLGCRH